jgi:hypothetical protein
MEDSRNRRIAEKARHDPLTEDHTAPVSQSNCQLGRDSVRNFRRVIRGESGAVISGESALYTRCEHSVNNFFTFDRLSHLTKCEIYRKKSLEKISFLASCEPVCLPYSPNGYVEIYLRIKVESTMEADWVDFMRMREQMGIVDNFAPLRPVQRRGRRQKAIQNPPPVP